MPARRQWRDFEEAREFARSLGLKRVKEWSAYAKSDDRPYDIPAWPIETYADSGWVSWSDWLGTGTVANYNRVYRPFEEAREFARSLGLKTQKEWAAYCKSGNKPADIPAEPRSYKGQYLGIGDWLGTGYIPAKYRKWRPFEEAREFARSLGLNSAKEWHAYSKSGNRPTDIPSNPDRIYKDQWLSYGDWLGTGTVATYNKVFRPFEEAREFARSLGLDSAAEWAAYAKSGQLPDDIPVNPPQFYGHKWKRR